MEGEWGPRAHAPHSTQLFCAVSFLLSRGTYVCVCSLLFSLTFARSRTMFSWMVTHCGVSASTLGRGSAVTRPSSSRSSASRLAPSAPTPLECAAARFVRLFARTEAYFELRLRVAIVRGEDGQLLAQREPVVA